MNEEFRKSPPAPLEPAPFELPSTFEAILSNGMKLSAIRDDRFPMVGYRLCFRRGDIHDPAGGTGTASAVASMLNEGTENYTSRELAEEIDRIGAGLSASAGSDNTLVRASGLSRFNDTLLDLLCELVLRPVFPEKELELYKQNAIEGLKYQRSQPDFLSDEQTGRLLFGNHPYSVSSPSETDYGNLERERMAAFHAETFVPDNAHLIAIGDFEPGRMLQDLEKRFEGWEPGLPPEREFPAPPVRDHRTLTFVDRPGSSQANIVIADLSIERNSPDYFPVLVMNQVLGAGASSRMFMNLREEKGYTYGAYSRIYPKRLLGSIEATAEVRNSVTGDSLKEMFYELERISAELTPENELEDAKNFLAGVFPIRAETQKGLLSLIVTQKLYDLPDDYLETYRENVHAVTAEEVQRVAEKYVRPERMAMVIVGDVSELLEQAKPYCDEIEVFDRDGAGRELSLYSGPAVPADFDASGAWELALEVQGQAVPVTMNLTRNESGFGGTLVSMLGEGSIREASLEDGRLNTVIVSEAQGQMIELELSCVFRGDEASGTITLPMMPDPIPFSGKRSGGKE